VRSPPDGYTLLLVAPSNAVNATLYQRLSFNFLRDAVPIAGLARSSLVLEATPSFPIATVPELIAYAKQNPGRINLASAGNGTIQHVAGELFKMMANVDMVHIPYRSSYVPDLLSGQVQIAFNPIPTLIGYIRSGQLRALAVTGAKRAPALPDVPTVSETVPGYEAVSWYGYGAPRNTPAERIEKLNAEINVALTEPTIVARLADLGAEPMTMTPASFGQLLADESEKWGKVVKAANIKVE